MKKSFIKMMLLLLTIAVGMINLSSCKYDDSEVRDLIAANTAAIKRNSDAIAAIQALINSGSVITDVTKYTEGYGGIKITLSNGNTYEITNGADGTDGANGKDGKDGKDAIVWTIGTDGYWCKDGVKTEYRALGENGATGATGNYYMPNAETGNFDLYSSDGTKIEATNISWKASGVSASITSDNYLLISNLEGETSFIKIPLSVLQIRATSMVVDGVYNNIFGMIKTSADIQTNMLFGFYGEFNDVTFPSTNAADYGDKSVILDSRYVTINSETVKGGTVYSPNLGTVYYTINPAEIDFTGMKMDLCNSQGQKAGITLSNAAKTEQAIKMGWSRAANTGAGVYQSTATVSDFSSIEKIELNGKKYVDALTAFQNSNYTSAITSLATAVKSTLSAFQTDAYALSSSDDNNHSIRSGLGIQAALIKPVSYATTAPIATSAKWSKSKILDITNKVIEKVYDKMKTDVDLSDLKTALQALQYAQHIVFSLDGVNIKVDVGKIPAEFEVNPMSGDVTVTKYQEAATTLTETELQSLASALNLSVSSTNDMIDNLNAACAQGIEIINKLSDTDLQNTTSSDMEGIMDEVWEKLDNIYGAVEYRYELALFVEEGNTITFPSSTLAKAPKVGSDITLRLTNMNLEMITPAYKKHVVCTWASNAKEVANINSSNASLNKVLDGTTKTISVSGLKSGVTYAFSYSGLDYAGKQETRVFYVTGK